jgi:membrane protein required for colicin V production
MPSYLDLGVVGVILLSALLAMMRGFTREVLAIGSWAAAAAAGYYFYPRVLPHLEPYVHKPIVAQGLAFAIVFFVTLVVVSLFTVRVSDAILDSKIGALDRSLGFVFGAARGFLLAVVAFAIFNWLVGDKQQPEWVKEDKTRPALNETASRIIAMLPEDAAASIENLIKSKSAAVVDELPPDETTAPSTPSPPSANHAAAPAAAPTPATVAPPRKTDAAPQGSGDKQKLDALINKNVPLPPPAPAPAVPTPAKP